MFPLAGAAGGFSQSGSADATNAGTIGGSYFGGITTGGSGLNTTTLLVIGSLVVLALLVLRK